MADLADLAALRQARAELVALVDLVDNSSAAILPPPDLPYCRLEPLPRNEGPEREGEAGATWEVPNGPRRQWIIQVPEERDDLEDDFVYVTTADLFPDVIPISSGEARRLARALFAAAAYRDGVRTIG